MSVNAQLPTEGPVSGSMTNGQLRHHGQPSPADGASARIVPKVLFINHAATLAGGELSLLSLAAAWGGERKVVLFENGPFCAQLRAAGIPVSVSVAADAVLDATRDSGRGMRVVAGVLAASAHISRNARKADVLIANSQKAFVIGALTAFLVRRPLVWQLRDILSLEHFASDRIRLVVNLANRIASRVICNSRATADAFIEAGGKTEKVRVVYGGIDPAPFDNVSPADVERHRAELAPEGTPLVGVFSRLAPWKGQHILLDAMRLLPDVRVVFVGGALFGEGGYALDLEQRARALGVENRLKFLGFRDDVPLLMRACDVIVHTSTAPEPFGRVIVEGMLAGRPVVATDAGGAREIVADGETGRLVRPGDPAALASAVRDLLDRPDEVERLAANGGQTARRRFSVASMVQAIEQIVTEVWMAPDLQAVR